METKIIETPVDKHKVEIKTWITGRDRRALRSVYLEASEITMQGENPEIKGITGKIAELAENKALEIMIISVNGKKENLINTVLDMHENDYEFIVKEINKVTDEKKTK